jgi:two-component system LytT family response regulator
MASFSIFTSKQKAEMIRTLIIDDEPHVRKTLTGLLENFCLNVQIAGEADSIESGLTAIRKLHPDMVLLDIQLKDGTGFELLRKLDNIEFKIIFVTAFEQYAIQAFRFSAVDYLLKPVDPEDLVEAIIRAEHVLKSELKVRLAALENNLTAAEPAHRKIVIRTSDSIHLIRQDDIAFCEADGSYTYINLRDNRRIITSRLLHDFDDMLAGNGFFRVHKSFLINLATIERFEKGEGGYVILAGNHKIPVASRKKDELMAMFEQMG